MGHFEPFLAYEASAGSGKTFNLVVRYLSLLFMGEDAGSITALTFTNKAANEMRQRVIETLRSLEKRGELTEISNVSGLSSDEILKRRDGVLWKLLRSDMKISTIDTFFGTILRKFALNAGIMPTFSALNQHHEVKFLKRFLHEIETQHQMEPLIQLSLLSSKRLNDIFSLLSSLYAKHKELEGVSLTPYRVDDTSIEKAMECAYALAKMMEDKPLSERARKTMQFESYEELLQKTWVFKPSMEYWDFKKVYEPRMDGLLREIQESIASQMQTYEGEFLEALFRILKIYIHSRQNLIRQNNELTFDDITLMVHDLLRRKLESEFLYFRLDGEMKHLLLDEFQDTSVLQFDILRPLIEEIAAGIGINEGGSFFFVGDVKQSIYRFRGGVSALFYEVAECFNVQVKALEVNYRSASCIVEFVNRVFESSMKRYISQKSPEEKKGGYVEVVVDEEPLRALLKEITILLSLGISYNDIAVLCVTNSDASRVQELLEEHHIHVVSEATSLLIHQRSVQAVIEYLRYCYFNHEIYRHNCATLIGCEVESIERHSIVDVLSQSIDFIRHHALGDKSALLFIEKLSQYRDIEAVIFEIERLEATSAQSDLEGVRIMTVHKSKGLEFEHVIVLDRLGQMKSRNNPLLYEYDGVSLTHLFVRTKGREVLDQNYQRALEKEEALANEDQLNALYVALTRAVESLVVIAKPKSSWFEPLQLTPNHWGEREHKHKEKKEIVPLKPFDYHHLSYGNQEEFVASLQADEHDYEAIQYGLALHYALEMMIQFDTQSIPLSVEAAKKRFGAFIGGDKLVSLEKTLSALVSNETFKRLTRGKHYKEQRFFFKEQMRVIDLLVEDEAGHWVVIDYKSGSEKSGEHEAQVRGYMEAVKALSGGEVSGYLCYLSENDVLIKNLI
ncbi:MAG: RecB-like helicase [Sulfuricurvum sp.]|uniref:RecB-like helicase n=1 Tax=Sulfuricurvum sp. TaxID=2025608 RepID=UPI00263901BE|nr:RecB-like helicase [Sulfuricurvum sp.]MDD2828020.1 RecB-like helicase [Sulfuricurvum sp.]MDD4948103.1 RecB-like helicase [Sulfuricurvum sp.]